jgi:hypothetical protein
MAKCQHKKIATFSSLFQTKCLPDPKWLFWPLPVLSSSVFSKSFFKVQNIVFTFSASLQTNYVSFGTTFDNSKLIFLRKVAETAFWNVANIWFGNIGKQPKH